MTEAAVATHAEPLQHLQVWAESLSQVLGQVSGSPVPAAVLSEGPADLPSQADDDLWLLCVYSGNLRGEACWRLPKGSVLRLAQSFMGESTPVAEITPEHREAVLELLRQVAGLAATALKPTWGEVVLRFDAAAGPPSWPASVTAWLRGGEETSASPLLEARLSAALVAGLRAEKPEAAKPAAAAATVATPSAAVSSEVKLDLLMDVELAVALRFGSRTLALREILDLNPGAVIDLDRQVGEPVDLLLDGRLLARGEVVVLDGNYALRVGEVAPGNPYGKS